MSYSPEQVEECADGYDALGEPVGASMLRAYAAALSAPEPAALNERLSQNTVLGPSAMPPEPAAQGDSDG